MYLLYRRYKFAVDMKLTMWKVNHGDIDFINTRTNIRGGSKAVSLFPYNKICTEYTLREFMCSELLLRLSWNWMELNYFQILLLINRINLLSAGVNTALNTFLTPC